MNKRAKVSISISKQEKDLINIVTGKKKSKNARDIKLSAEVKGIKRRGGQVYIPHD